MKKAANGKRLKKSYSTEKKALKMYNGKQTKETTRDIKDLANKIVHKTKG